MLPDLVSNPGPLTYESGVLPIALRGPAKYGETGNQTMHCSLFNRAALRSLDFRFREHHLAGFEPSSD